MNEQLQFQIIALQEEIKKELENYTFAIHHDNFEEAKIIQHRIRSLQIEMDELLPHIHLRK